MLTMRVINEDPAIEKSWLGPGPWTLEVTDGRQTRRIGEQHLDACVKRLAGDEPDRLRFSEVVFMQVGAQERPKTQTVFWILGDGVVRWEVKTDMAALGGTVRSVAVWPREELRRVLRAAQVAKSLRAASERHQVGR